MALPWSLVTVSGTEVKDGMRVYAVHVKPAKDGDAPFVLKKRYNMFRHLHKEVQRATSRRHVAAFPEKGFKTDVEARRRGLDEWLAETVSLARSPEHAVLKPLLFEFLSERSIDPEVAHTPFSDAAVGIAAVRIHHHEDRDGTVWYAVDIYPPGGAVDPVRMWKSYTMMKHLQRVTGASPSTFPGKTLSKKLSSEKQIVERRTLLDHWLTALIDDAKADPALMAKVRKFCIPTATDDDDDDGESSSETPGSPTVAFRVKGARLTGTEERGGTVYYKVEVAALRHDAAAASSAFATPPPPAQQQQDDDASSSQPSSPVSPGGTRHPVTTHYTVWKRYNQFHYLHDAVCRVDPTASDDFPSKSMRGAEVTARRKQLDFWLAKVISAAVGGSPARPALRPLLNSFLDPAQKLTDAFDSVSAPPIESVVLKDHEDRQGTVFYSIDVTLTEGGASFRVWKSYSMFRELCTTCSHLVLGTNAFNGFPPKHVNPVKMMTHDKASLLRERHSALAAWFEGMVQRCKKDYEMLRPALREFLDSKHV